MHPKCKHNTSKCACSTCWKLDSQCPDQEQCVAAVNEKIQQHKKLTERLQQLLTSSQENWENFIEAETSQPQSEYNGNSNMDRPNKRTRQIPDNHDRKQQNNNISTQNLHHTTTTNNCDSPQTKRTKRHNTKTNDRELTERTTEQTSITLSDSEDIRQENFHILNQHDLSCNERINISPDITDFGNITKNDLDLSKNKERPIRTTSDKFNRPITNSDPWNIPGTSRYNTIDEREHLTEENDNLDNFEETSDRKIVYTFIIHKSNHRKDIPPYQHRANSPAFATFDHGDHYHFLFTVSHENNVARSINRILAAIGAINQSIAEANNTLQRVRMLKRFIYYCIRKGIRTFKAFGNISSDIIRIIKDLSNNTQEETDGLEPCEMYIEQKKSFKTITTNRNYQVDYIQNLIQEYNIQTYQQFIKNIPESVQVELLKQSGNTGQQLIKYLIQISKIKRKIITKYTHYYDIIFQNYDNKKVNHENVNYLINILKANKIDIAHFFATFILIQSMTLQKINTFVLQGLTNTGKSMIMGLLTEHLDSSTIHREKDKTSFHLDELPAATSVLFEEPIIDQTNVGTWKQLMEGATIYTDIKHSSKEPINRLPVFITTNHNLWMWCSNDADPIKERCFFHKLDKRIKSIENNLAPLPPPPTTITVHDIYEVIIKYFPSIEDKAENLLAQTSKNKDYIKPTQESMEYILKQHYLTWPNFDFDTQLFDFPDERQETPQTGQQTEQETQNEYYTTG